MIFSSPCATGSETSAGADGEATGVGISGSLMREIRGRTLNDLASSAFLRGVLATGSSMSETVSFGFGGSGAGSTFASTTFGAGPLIFGSAEIVPGDFLAGLACAFVSLSDIFEGFFVVVFVVARVAIGFENRKLLHGVLFGGC